MSTGRGSLRCAPRSSRYGMMRRHHDDPYLHAEDGRSSAVTGLQGVWRKIPLFMFQIRKFSTPPIVTMASRHWQYCTYRYDASIVSTMFLDAGARQHSAVAMRPARSASDCCRKISAAMLYCSAHRWVQDPVHPWIESSFGAGTIRRSLSSRCHLTVGMLSAWG